MRGPSLLGLLMLSLDVVMTAPLTARATFDRQGLSQLVDQILGSMVAHDPTTLPLAPVYKATENSHPAALTMMTSWRTIVSAGTPSLLAIDVTNQTAYFALDISEGNADKLNILRGRVATQNQKITELELFINRWRGDHGFSFSAAELPSNYALVADPPEGRTLATRAELYNLSSYLFAEEASDFAVSDTCKFTEIGWSVIDRGNYNNGTTTPISCGWPAAHPYDVNARVGLVIDEELGIVVTSGIIPGRVYAEANVSAFIPDAFPDAQEAQVKWFEATEGQYPLLAPQGATGDTLEVLQMYDGAIQAMQINVFLSGPNMTSPWLS